MTVGGMGFIPERLLMMMMIYEVPPYRKLYIVSDHHNSKHVTLFSKMFGQLRITMTKGSPKSILLYTTITLTTHTLHGPRVVVVVVVVVCAMGTGILWVKTWPAPTPPPPPRLEVVDLCMPQPVNRRSTHGDPVLVLLYYSSVPPAHSPLDPAKQRCRICICSSGAFLQASR